MYYNKTRRNTQHKHSSFTFTHSMKNFVNFCDVTLYLTSSTIPAENAMFTPHPKAVFRSTTAICRAPTENSCFLPASINW